MRLERWDYYGYKQSRADHRFRLSERALEMVKVAALIALAAWFGCCAMAMVYSKEIAQVMVERRQ